MNLIRVSLNDLRARSLSTALNLLLLGLGVATVVVIILISGQLEERLTRDAHGIDLVVGAKGTPMQIVLSSLYQLDVPTGDISWEEAQRVAADPAVTKAIPIALGDNFWGFRIVGTDHDYLTRYGATPREGRLWQWPGEAVVGADVAARMNIAVGATIVSAHGLKSEREQLHQEQPYRIVGVLERTGSVVDRLVLTDVASVSALHVQKHGSDASELITEPPLDDGRRVTALLIECTSRSAAGELAGRVNAGGDLQAALPELEVGRLFRFIGVGAEVLWGFALVLILAAGLSVFIALYNELRERRQDLAIMRALGANRTKLMTMMLFEGVMLAAAGAVIGVFLGHALTGLVGIAVRRTHQVSLTGWTWMSGEGWVIALTLVVGFIAALVPAWRARDIDIAATLARD